MADNTRYLMDFEISELRLAGRLLCAFRDPKLDRTKFLGDVITPEKNPDSGFIFLIDSNFNIARINGQFLEDWYRCENCNLEGFFCDLKSSLRKCCVDHLHKCQETLKVA
jgi:hypothetical protein